jgi:hypothetical protein
VRDPDMSRRAPRDFRAEHATAPAASADRLLYHVAPRHARASIERHGLDSARDSLPGLAGTYLWETIAQASAYAAPLGDDIWIVECTGILLAFCGPFSIVPGERWTLDPIPRERLRRRPTTVITRKAAWREHA